MRHHIKLLLFFLASGLLFAACEDNKPDYSQLLPGYWTLSTAERNGEPTQTLEGTWFEFTDDQRVMTNMPVGSSDGYPFELVDKKIHQKSPMEIVYKIQDISENSLTLKLEARGMEFLLSFDRSLDRPESEEPLNPVQGVDPDATSTESE